MTPVQLDRFIGKLRFAELDEDLGECWLWTGYVNVRGYARCPSRFTSNRSRLAHRAAFEHWNGPIPEECEIDHLCRNKACVNPRHLEAVSHAKNMARSLSPLILPRVNVGNAHTLGRRLSPEHRARIIAANRGLVRSAETRAKMAAAKRLYWAQKRGEAA